MVTQLILTEGMRNCLLVCAALALVCACGKKKAEAEAEPVAPVRVAVAQRGPIQRIIAAEAVLQPVNQANVMPKISAPVRTFYVNRGSHVKQGQLLAVLENKDLAAAAAESKGAFEQAESNYRSTTAATVPEEVAKSQQDVQAAKQTADAAQKLYESRQQLLKEGALARRLVDEAAVSYAQAKAAYETAQKHLEALQSVGKQEQIKGAQGQVDAARGHYQGAEAQLAYSEIRSPIAGIVSDRPVYPGEMANSGSPLLTVVDISRVIARAIISVKEANLLRVGLPATIALPDGSTQVEGKVTVVSPAVDPNTTTVEVWIEARNTGELLKPGETVHVSIPAQTIPDALLVPAAALLSSQEGGNQVLTVGADSLAHERKVEIGVRQDDKVQILSGVNAGDKVIVEGGVGLQDKAKVEVLKPGEEPGAKEADDKADEKPGKKAEKK